MFWHATKGITILYLIHEALKWIRFEFVSQIRADEK